MGGCDAFPYTWITVVETAPAPAPVPTPTPTLPVLVEECTVVLAPGRDTKRHGNQLMVHSVCGSVVGVQTGSMVVLAVAEGDGGGSGDRGVEARRVKLCVLRVI